MIERIGSRSHETEAPASERITRIRRRYQTGPAYISAERARYYTEKWRETEGTGTPLPVRVALSMKHVYQNMTHYLDPDDRIAGCWTEFFLGIPVDVERGVFNRVLEAELTAKDLIRARGRSLARGLSYMIRKGTLREFLKNQRAMKASGAPPLNMGIRTMSEREINPFQIRGGDRRLLLNNLLPYWRGKTVVDVLERELAASGLYSRDMKDLVAAIPGNTSRQVLMLSTCATIASIQGHVILDFERVLARGLDAMRAEVEDKRRAVTNGDRSKRDFLESLAIALEGVETFARRLAERIEREAAEEADPARKTVLEGMLVGAFASNSTSQ